ncbi:peptidoglycan-binding protein [Streptomyces sp. RFCAC02]|uniref:peptidoglycan-binding domain-containing protein n=1 Tax=Streptomyces sp. RFCAC02 TaxID=2499143 RepID=UPI0010213A53|nr:peptidoglycan-binding protein [Streptomyces sp. RFCAC02]
MPKRNTVRLGFVGGVAMAAAVAGLIMPSTAQASVAQGYVVGAGVITDDFGDEGPLSTSQNSYNNVVGMWQGILWADGYLESSDRDCMFGPVTHAATVAWQEDHGLDGDGIVGPKTFGTADDFLFWDGNEIKYDGAERNLSGMYRDSQGRYYGDGVQGQIVYVSYTATDAPICS